MQATDTNTDVSVSTPDTAPTLTTPQVTISPKKIVTVAALTAIVSQFFPWVNVIAPFYGSVSFSEWDASWMDALLMTGAAVVAALTINNLITKQHWNILSWIPYFWVPTLTGLIIAGNSLYVVVHGSGVASSINDDYVHTSIAFGAYLALVSGAAVTGAGWKWRKEQEGNTSKSAEEESLMGQPVPVSAEPVVRRASSTAQAHEIAGGPRGLASHVSDTPPSSLEGDVRVSLMRLRELKDQGLLSDDEFQRKSRQIIDRAFPTEDRQSA